MVERAVWVHEMSRTDPRRGGEGQGNAQLVDHIVRELRDRVFAGTLPVGSWLRQEAVAAEFAVSRTPVREALRELQARGIVSLLPNRGALVRGPTLEEVREAYVIRAELEGLAARLAASRVSAADVDRLRQAEALFERASRPAGGAAAPARTPPAAQASVAQASVARAGDWHRANDLFHEVILAAAGNQRLRLMIADLHRAFPRSLTWSALLSSAGKLEENAAQHRRIRQALQARDGEEARRRMIAHVAHAGDLVEAWFASHVRA
jgi:DNA-binding GntR family transcriptional regulator